MTQNVAVKSRFGLIHSQLHSAILQAYMYNIVMAKDVIFTKLRVKVPLIYTLYVNEILGQLG